ncbi:MAG: GGDEF domain-containing protein [Lachnospiraceae bacterium]|nr:GGDEF domain-containing protein [Lachnospiraceae bacterium]
MTAKEIYLVLQNLREIFDVARLVDAGRTEVCRVSADGKMVREPLRCYEVWKKEQRCINCISAKVCPQHNRIEKYEFVDDEVYHITSKLVEVEGESFALEIVSKTSDDTLFEAYGKETFMETIQNMNRKMYVDAMTEAYNRRYYDEQIMLWKDFTALAIVDVDHFKEVNDTFGHSIGDEALKAIAEVLKMHIRSQDAVIRYGGDEFLMVYTDITKEAFALRIEETRESIAKICLEHCPELKLTVTIGGVYVTAVPEHEKMFEQADRLLYKAKAERNKVELLL